MFKPHSQTRNYKFGIVLSLSVVTALFSTPLEAGEGAFSNYFPGAYGSLLPGMAPETGNVFASVNLLYDAKASRAVNQGQVQASIKSQAFYSLFQGLHVWDAPELGGKFAVGGYLPLGYASYSSSVGGLANSQDEVALGDFKGEAVGIGPAVSWIPKSAGGAVALSASWVHDVHSKNRLSGDYGAISLSYQF